MRWEYCDVPKCREGELTIKLCGLICITTLICSIIYNMGSYMHPVCKHKPSLFPKRPTQGQYLSVIAIWPENISGASQLENCHCFVY